MKPGYRTTEFYGAIVAAGGMVVSALAGGLSDAHAAKYSSYVAIGYAIARGLAKMFPPKPPL